MLLGYAHIDTLRQVPVVNPPLTELIDSIPVIVSPPPPIEERVEDNVPVQSEPGWNTVGPKRVSTERPPLPWCLLAMQHELFILLEQFYRNRYN